ncbi:hypothetical protein HDU76_008338 [Blyttiomyces sp. JEL0837]|nr:hypothetical protein HDU76_008338 [Blyttiomyces sp. JEL0837]
MKLGLFTALSTMQDCQALQTAFPSIVFGQGASTSKTLVGGPYCCNSSSVANGMVEVSCDSDGRRFIEQLLLNNIRLFIYIIPKSHIALAGK